MPETVIASYAHAIDRTAFYNPNEQSVDDARFIVGDLVTRVTTLQTAKRPVSLKVDKTTITISTNIETPPPMRVNNMAADDSRGVLRVLAERETAPRTTPGGALLRGIRRQEPEPPKPIIAGEVSVRVTPSGDLSIVFAERWTDMVYVPGQYLDELSAQIRAAKAIQRRIARRLKAAR